MVAIRDPPRDKRGLRRANLHGHPMVGHGSEAVAATAGTAVSAPGVLIVNGDVATTQASIVAISTTSRARDISEPSGERPGDDLALTDRCP